MSSLFRRFFVSFFASTILIVVAVAAGGALFLTRRSSALELPRFESARAEAQQVLSARGIGDLGAWIAMTHARMRPIQVDVVDTRGHSILPGSPESIALPADGGQPARGHGAVLTRPLRGPDGTPYTFVMFVPNSRIFGVLNERAVLLTLGPFALAVMLVACFAVARSLTIPIEELRRATQRLAHGNLDATVGAVLLARQDEVGQLARDFASMADSMRRLLESKQELVRDLSHELRTPISRMRLAIGLATMRPQEAHESLARAEAETERLDELIERMLQLSRISDPAWHPAFERIAIGDMLRGIVHDATTECEARRVSVRVEASDELVVDGVPEQLRSACENVLRNALRYSPEGGEVVLRARTDGADCVLTTEDRGPGVPPESLERIFQPLYRLKDAREARRPATASGSPSSREWRRCTAAPHRRRTASPAGCALRSASGARSRSDA